MASSPPNDKLTPLQRRVLRAFFDRERGFFAVEDVSGGHVGLHALDRHVFERGRHVLMDVASEIDALLEIRRHEPRFQRAVLTTADAALVVDLELRSP